ncbi:MAG: TonB-dependent receptor, partial [Sphingomonadales bacterium]|nr:TonB-dependent receptor [Sphingomonadales bacterium]MDE2570577.1 TonB-dependent receptor [Sphingomonadales bacterium]
MGCRTAVTARTLVSALALVAGAGLAHAGETGSAPAIIVTGYGLSDTPASPAYDVQTIERGQIAVAASGRIE